MVLCDIIFCPPNNVQQFTKDGDCPFFLSFVVRKNVEIDINGIVVVVDFADYSSGGVQTNEFSPG